MLPSVGIGEDLVDRTGTGEDLVDRLGTGDVAKEEEEEDVVAVAVAVSVDDDDDDAVSIAIELHGADARRASGFGGLNRASNSVRSCAPFVVSYTQIALYDDRNIT
jgi:hypothetical protein